MKIIIVGGVAGGASCAARIRRLDENAEVIIYEKSGYISYANCGLPYYIGDIITEKEALTLQTPEGFWDRFRIRVHVLHEVIKINPDDKTVTVQNLSTGETFEENYDKLLLATGAVPVMPRMEDSINDRIFTLRNVEDTYKIKAFIHTNKPKSVTVVGGGYVGVEMAENLKRLGLDVTLIEFADHILAPLDFDMATFVHAKLEAGGVKLMLHTAALAFAKTQEQILSKTTNGDVLSDFVIYSIGVVPDTRLAREAGLALGIKGAITVNDRMETSVADIYAVGDAVEVKHFITGEKTLLSLAGPANKQGRIAADNMCGGASTYRGAQGSSVIRVFDMTVAATGLNEAGAKAAHFDYEKVVLSPMSHAGYYPGGQVMAIKVLFDRKTEKILGGQIVGYAGVDKRIDVLATAIRGGMRARALAELDLAYAPPYSSAKDPMNMAGFIIENIVTGKVKQFHFEDICTLPQDGSVFLLDARTPHEYALGHADGFVNIPLDALRERLKEIPQGKPVYVMCQSGLRSYLAARILTLHGFDAYNFAGGYGFYDTIRRGRMYASEATPCGMDKK